MPLQIAWIWFSKVKNYCKMSKKLENLHDMVVSKIFLEPYHDLGFPQLNET